MPDMDPSVTSSNFSDGPVRPIPGDSAQPLRDELGLCLSGGGYRAMLFHLGSLWRLNQAGLLPALTCVSSVSGGSISAIALAARWGELDFGPSNVARRFGPAVVEPVRELARHTIDVRSV